ncbi:MAG: hypothetical protein R3D57_18170 [Hyphomicrobiaceae bacterium]
MTTGKRQRGRPKGSGINDRETLLRIAEIIAANPAIKPTTAIKQAGITNPSTIRRLRDKFSAQGDQLLAEVRGRQDTLSNATVTPIAARPRINATVTPATKVSQRISPLASSLSGPTLQPRPAQTQASTQARAPSAPAGTARRAQSRPAAPRKGDTLGLPTNIEALVLGMIGDALGVKGPALTASPIIALIKEQAKMIDAILPILKTQLQSAERHMKKATVA